MSMTMTNHYQCPNWDDRLFLGTSVSSMLCVIQAFPLLHLNNQMINVDIVWWIFLLWFFRRHVQCQLSTKMKWNESGFRPPLCTYRLNWARRTSWGWWDDWDDTVLQTQDSKFEPWRSEAEHATSRSRRLPAILTSTRGWGRNIFCFFQTAETGDRTPNSGVKGSGANHYTMAPAPSCLQSDTDHTATCYLSTHDTL